jgi:succinylglutamate desuccinylase
MKVVIVGGTHGNEKTGVYLVNKFINLKNTLPNFHDYKFFIGNPKATDQNLRFLDYDLNRSFNKGLSNNSQFYEIQRSQELKSEILKWAGKDPFFLIDLHTTTANMGKTVVISKNDRLTAETAKILITLDPSIKILFNSDMDNDSVFVDSIAPHGLIIEIGPISQNIYDWNTIESTEKLTLQILEILNKVEKKASSLDPVLLSGFKEVGMSHFKLNSDQIPEFLIHPNLLFKDYQPVNFEDPVFISQEGKNILSPFEKTFYPVFINEAAYLKSGIAFLRTHKAELLF